MWCCFTLPSIDVYLLLLRLLVMLKLRWLCFALSIVPLKLHIKTAALYWHLVTLHLCHPSSCNSLQLYSDLSFWLWHHMNINRNCSSHVVLCLMLWNMIYYLKWKSCFSFSVIIVNKSFQLFLFFSVFC